MRVIVTGSRNWEDRDLIWEELRGLWYWSETGLTVIHGGCPTGADKMASDWAAPLKGDWNVRERIFHADWRRDGKAAGPIRNRMMVQAGADACLAFIKNGSRGASGCARMAEEAGIKVYRFEVND